MVKTFFAVASICLISLAANVPGHALMCGPGGCPPPATVMMPGPDQMNSPFMMQPGMQPGMQPAMQPMMPPRGISKVKRPIMKCRPPACPPPMACAPMCIPACEPLPPFPWY